MDLPAAAGGDGGSPTKRTTCASKNFEDDVNSSPSKTRDVADLSVSFSVNTSLDDCSFDPNDSGSDFGDDLPLLQQDNTTVRKLLGESALAEAEKRTYMRPSETRKSKNTTYKPYHSALHQHLNFKESQEHLGSITITKALQECPKILTENKYAEELFRERRPWHSSPVVTRVAEHVSPSRIISQECPHDARCQLLDNEEHISRFTHECKSGFFCIDTDATHRHCFRHPRGDSANPWAGKSGWKADNSRSPGCAPEMKMSSLQTGLPHLSCNPRGGFRPQGGTQYRTEVRDLHAERLMTTNDAVTMIVHNIDPLWSHSEFYEFLRDLMGTRRLVSAKVVEGPSESVNVGKGLVSCYNYSDAHLLKTLMQNRTIKGREELVRVEYSEKVVRTGDEFNDWRRKMCISESCPAILRYNQIIVKCGPYWQDAEGVIARMREEGYSPSVHTYVALLLAYRSARPPQPKRAEVIFQTMQNEGLPISTTAGNCLVDAWCRAGNMVRAEKVVARMERSAKSVSKWNRDTPHDKATRMPSPNEQTYLILAEAWQRLGVMEDIAQRQRGFKYDEQKEKNHRDVSIGGNLGMAVAAPSVLTSLARRRAGYSHMNTGYQSQQANEEFFGSFESQKWRSRI